MVWDGEFEEAVMLGFTGLGLVYGEEGKGERGRGFTVELYLALGINPGMVRD